MQELKPQASLSVSSLQAVEAEEFDRLLRGTLQPDDHKHGLAVGVSGGADSMALTLLAAEWARAHGAAFTALSVDHDLRPGSDAEAETVGRWLTARGIEHHILTWQGNKPTSGIQAAARQARLGLLGDWCRAHASGGSGGARVLLLAHHRDDLVETVLLRIAADSGPDGLAGIASRGRVGGVLVLRPLLSVAKPRLIDTCRAFEQDWIEDPSNQDTKFERIRLRKLAPELGASGLTPDRLTRFSSAMRGARDAMDRERANFLRAHGSVHPAGFVVLSRDALVRQPARFAELVLAQILQSVGGRDYPPRTERVARLRDHLAEGFEQACTLGHCLIEPLEDGKIRIQRETIGQPNRLMLRPGIPQRWDNRFELSASVTGAASTDNSQLSVEMLNDRNWRRLLRQTPSARDLLAEAGIPNAARSGLPIVSGLDGSLWLPHLSGGHEIGVQPPHVRVLARFSPTNEWITSLTGNLGLT